MDELEQELNEHVIETTEEVESAVLGNAHIEAGPTALDDFPHDPAEDNICISCQ